MREKTRRWEKNRYALRDVGWEKVREVHCCLSLWPLTKCSSQTSCMCAHAWENTRTHTKGRQTSWSIEPCPALTSQQAPRWMSWPTKEKRKEEKTNLWLLNLRGLCHVSYRMGGYSVLSTLVAAFFCPCVCVDATLSPKNGIQMRLICISKCMYVA